MATESPNAQVALDSVVRGFEAILDGVHPDWRQDAHLQDTPRRAAKAWLNEIFQGSLADDPRVTTFPSEGDSGMVVLNHIPVRSVCAHHLLPFIGHASVGYTADSMVIGLSKLSRITDHFSRRPQVQERLTNQIADYIQDLPGVTGVGVVVRANHMCMSLRGVKHDGDMLTSALRGAFVEKEARAEFLKLSLGE